eukprot:GFYU01001198.1.p1 GENE.GFYU01001198.1~~GFYU01001198.1.p1  ORF type:complete len:423 (+),score=114.34 GFYU01001198.1:93-1361(+)
MIMTSTRMAMMRTVLFLGAVTSLVAICVAAASESNTDHTPACVGLDCGERGLNEDIGIAKENVKDVNDRLMVNPPKKKVTFWVWDCINPGQVAAALTSGIPRDQIIISPATVYTIGEDGELMVNQEQEDAMMDFVHLGFETQVLIGQHALTDDTWRPIYKIIKNPAKFIATTVRHAVQKKFSGYNLDWEAPIDDNHRVNIDDMVMFVNFLNMWADALHAAGKTLSIDMAWGYSLVSHRSILAQTRVDKIMTEDTYVGTIPDWSAAIDTMFTSYVAYNQMDIPQDKLSFGIVTRPLSGYSIDHVKWQFDFLQEAGAQEICIWTGVGMPDGYMDLVVNWIKAPLLAPKYSPEQKSGARWIPIGNQGQREDKNHYKPVYKGAVVYPDIEDKAAAFGTYSEVEETSQSQCHRDQEQAQQSIVNALL